MGRSRKLPQEAKGANFGRRCSAVGPPQPRPEPSEAGPPPSLWLQRAKMAEEGAPGRRGERERERGEEGPAERGPGAAFHMFVLMEDLLDKLKLLSYEEEALRRHNMRPLSRCSWPGGRRRGRGRGAAGRNPSGPSDPAKEGRAPTQRARFKGKPAGCKASRMSWKLSKREAS